MASFVNLFHSKNVRSIDKNKTLLPLELSSIQSLLLKKVKPNPSLPEEYVLDRSKVLDVISIIDNQGRQFEKTPKTYKDFGEEDLRNVILVSLNSLFEGKATGETFSHKRQNRYLSQYR